MRTLSELIPEGLSILKKNRLSGIPSGFECIDNLTNGWQKASGYAPKSIVRYNRNKMKRSLLIN